MRESRPLGIFGGTFDPVHYGHLRSAWELLEILGLEQVCFIPAGEPPHRPAPRTAAALRLKMVQAAVAGEPRFTVDDCELRRTGPSYSVDTLTALRARHGERAICLLLGMDAFLGLPDWHRAERILELVHVVVVHRPGWTHGRASVHASVASEASVAPDVAAAEDAQWPAALVAMVANRQVWSADALRAAPAGCVLLQPVTQLSISSSGIRELVAAGRDPRYLVPDCVREMVIESECYTEKARE